MMNPYFSHQDYPNKEAQKDPYEGAPKALKWIQYSWVGALIYVASRLCMHYTHYCRMLLMRHYDQRPFDETVCDAIIANGGVKKP